MILPSDIGRRCQVVETFELVRFIRAHEGIMAEEASEQIGVSTRTLRTYVSRANDALDGVASITLVRGEGYHLDVQDPSALESWLSEWDGSSARGTCKTSEERVSYLLNDLLMRSDWIKLQDLSKALYVSKSALSGDLKKVEERLRAYDLVLEKRSHYGIRVVGGEMSRRLCLANAAIEASRAEVQNSVSGNLGSHMLKTLAGSALKSDEQLIEAIASCVTQVSKEHDMQINAAAFQNLLVHIVVALIRISEDCYVPIEQSRLQQIIATAEFRVAEEIAERIAAMTSVTLPREEIAYIAIHLAGKQTIYQSPDGASLVISDEVWQVVSDMLERVWHVFRFDFRTDLELRMNLARHIQPLSVRLRYNMKLKNPMLEDIKARYPLSFSIAMDASSVIADMYDASLSHDEIGYIALAFELALERSKTVAAKKNILVICASGAGSARLLEYQCRREFGDYIDQVQTCDVLSLDKVDFSRVDYAFTTVPLNRELPVPVREVSCFLDEAEAERTRMMLRKDFHQLGLGAGRYVGKDLFFPHLSVTSKEDVLDFLIDRAMQARRTAVNFRELVLAREKCMATAFGNNIAMPHPIEVASEDAFVCVGLLDEPISWGAEGEKAQAIFLMGFSFDEDGDARSFLDGFTGMLMDAEAIGRIVAEQTWDVFEEELGHFGIAVSADRNQEP